MIDLEQIYTELRKFWDRLWSERNIRLLLFMATIFTIIIIFLIGLFVFMESIPTYTSGVFWETLTQLDWSPSYKHYGVLPLIFSSILVVGIALAIATPLGILSAVFITEFAPKKLRDLLESLLELLAAIPSVIYGFMGLIYLVPAIANTFGLSSGRTALAGGLVLAIMVLPTISSISTEMMRYVPQAYREVALALGATKWQTARSVVIPTARSGIVAAIILAFGRAIGETVAVLFVCGASGSFPAFPFIFEPVFPLTAVIAMYMGESVVGGELYSVLFYLGVILFLISIGINLLADYFVHKAKEKMEVGVVL